jgi:hypothetical protein
MSLFTFINTFGGGADANDTKIRANDFSGIRGPLNAPRYCP